MLAVAELFLAFGISWQVQYARPVSCATIYDINILSMNG